MRDSRVELSGTVRYCCINRLGGSKRLKKPDVFSGSVPVTAIARILAPETETVSSDAPHIQD